MVAPEGFPWVFRDVQVDRPDRVFLIAGDVEADEQDLPVSWLLCWVGNWVHASLTMTGTSITFTHNPEPSALTVGPEGTVARWGKAAPVIEHVDPSAGGPQHYGDLREIRTIDDRTYVVGMRRTAYRCDAPASWTRIDAGLRCAADDDSDAGLNSVHGFDGKRIIAVGWDGEIWRFDGSAWMQIDSPTNLALNRVVSAPNGNVYACGQRGILVCGTGDLWRVIEQDATDDTFWGATWFHDRLYLATANGLFRLMDDRLEPVAIQAQTGSRPIETMPNCCFGRLDANEEVIWSVGEKMAIYSSDGVTWAETSYT